ncbi:MAG: hypothetical protein JRJ68_02660 [Deltaproteobacteria bacterium]|nr:hypothetical protein [Deltaproteobacteria bacterium]
MPSAETKEIFRQIGWNGIRLTVPCSWETHVGGRNHLIFEKDFSPVLEMRWQERENKKSANARSVSKQIKKTDTTLHEKELPREWSFLKEKFDVTCYGRKRESSFSTAVCTCRHCQALIFFQLNDNREKIDHLLKKSMKSLSCCCAAGSRSFWSIQDFQLQLPSEYSLTDYSLAAGLSRISFQSGRMFLHTCKLSPADNRLNSHSLEDILKNLADVQDLQVHQDENGMGCRGYRKPTITSQILLRLQRKKPFIRAEIRHDTSHNRLLAVILESIKPIRSGTCQAISNNYEIIQI